LCPRLVLVSFLGLGRDLLVGAAELWRLRDVSADRACEGGVSSPGIASNSTLSEYSRDANAAQSGVPNSVPAPKMVLFELSVTKVACRMGRNLALRPIVLGALIGVAITAFITTLICVVWAWPFGFPLVDLDASQRMNKVEGIRVLGAVTFAFVAGPLGALIGAVCGAIRRSRRRRHRGVVDAPC